MAEKANKKKKKSSKKSSGPKKETYDVRGSKSKFRFSDSDTVFQHDFMLYVFGAEVTRHVRGTISVNRQNRESPGTMSFDLDNVNDIFTITSENLGYRKTTDGEYVPIELDDSRATDVSSVLADSVKKKVDELEKQIADKKENRRDPEAALEEAESSISRHEQEIERLTQSLEGVSKKSKEYKSISASIKTQKSELAAEKKSKAAYENAIKKIDGEIAVLEKKKTAILGNIRKTSDGRYVVAGNFGSSANGSSNERDNRSGSDKYSKEADRTKNKKKKAEASKKSNLSSAEVIKALSLEELNEDGMYSDAAKKLVYTNKSILNADIKSGGFIKGVEFDSSFKPYSLEMDSCIFEKNDPVRFFIKDPCSAEDEDKWAPMFTGFIQNITDHTDYLTGEKYFTIACYDVRAMMQNMRVMMNPRISHGTDTAYDLKNLESGNKKKIGLFGDYIAHSGNGGEKGSKYMFSRADEVVLDMITGRVRFDPKFGSRTIGNVCSTQSEIIVSGEKYDLDKVNNGTKLHKTSPGYNGVGCFMPGLTIKCPDSQAKLVNQKYELSQDHVNAMELWHDVLVFGTKADYWTQDDVRRVGEATIPYGEFDPWCGWLHFLTPADGTTAANLFGSHLDDLSDSFDFSTRFQVMNQLCETIDYQWYCNGSGDIIVEFPMYDFIPDSFGAYADQMRVSRHLVSCEINEITKDIVTGMSVTGGITRSTTDVQGPIAFVYTGFAKSDSLAFKYGMKVEEMTIPSMSAASGRDRLSRQAAIELVKANVLATSMSMEMVYRWALYPNKPILNVDRNRLAVIDAFQYSLAVNENVSCGVDCSYVRKKRVDGSFIHIFNGTSMPVQYTTKGNVDTSGLDETDSGIDVFVIKK